MSEKIELFIKLEHRKPYKNLTELEPYKLDPDKFTLNDDHMIPLIGNNGNKIKIDHALLETGAQIKQRESPTNS